MTSRDPLLRIANKIYRKFDAQVDVAEILSQSNYMLDETCQRITQLQQLRQLLMTAQRQNWRAATEHVRQRMILQLEQLKGDATMATKLLSQAATESVSVSLSTIVAELQQLDEEFENVTFDPKNACVIAVTPPIILEDMPLGPFAIKLKLKKLARSFDISCFDCEALNPNFCGDGGYTHPHVSDGQLCAGDATVPIGNALKQGRLCDAFCLIRSVLQTYNGSSAYVALEDWNGTSCQDCGRSMSSDASYYCPDCENDVCENCISSCDECGESYCRGCLDHDEEADEYLCYKCRRTCQECGRIVNHKHLDENKRCPQCAEEAEEAAEAARAEAAEAEAEDEQEEENDEPNIPGDATSKPTDPANPADPADSTDTPAPATST